MPDQEQETQETEEGLTIPVPKRGDFFRDLEKVAKPRKPSDDAGSGSPED